MPRVPMLTTRESVPPEAWPAFDSITASRGRVGGPFGVLMNSPEVAGRIAHLGTYIRFESSLPPKLRELAIITTVREWNCGVEWAGHSVIAQQEGVPASTVDLIAHRRPADSLPEDERMVVRYVQELLSTGRVSDEAFAAAHKAFGDRGVTDLTATIGYYCVMGCVLGAMEVESAPDAPKLPELSR